MKSGSVVSLAFERDKGLGESQKPFSDDFRFGEECFKHLVV